MSKKPGILISVLCLIIGLLVGIIIGMFCFNKNRVPERTVEKDVQSTEAQNMIEEEGYIIETKYCDLYYPAKWESQVRVDQVEEDKLTVKFFGIVDGKTEQYLFDIVFGGREGTKVGTISTDSGNVNVYVKSEGFVFDDTWTEEEKNTIHTMQEDINYLLEMLEKEEGFKAE